MECLIDEPLQLMYMSLRAPPPIAHITRTEQHYPGKKKNKFVIQLILYCCFKKLVFNTGYGCLEQDVM